MPNDIYKRNLERLTAVAREFEGYVGSKDNPGPATDREVEALAKALPGLLMASHAIFVAGCISHDIEHGNVG